MNDVRLATTSLADFTERLSTAEPVPGGGSAAALTGSLAAGLVAMVAALSQGPRFAEADASRARTIEDAARALRAQLLALVDGDADAYAAVVAARRLPRGTAHEQEVRRDAIATAMGEAARAPLAIADRTDEVLALAEQLVHFGNRNAITDLGVAVRLGGAALHGALLNVRINLPHLAADDPLLSDSQPALERLAADAERHVASVLEAVEAVMATPGGGR